MRSTRAEVAKLAGVSPSVVSYVLNGGPRNVAPETRQRVEEAIASLEYRPNAIAQALRGGRSGAIGVVVGEQHELLFRASSLALQRAALDFGYATYVSFAHDAATERQYVRSLVDRQVDALLAIGVTQQDVLLDVRADGLPVAFVGQTATLDRVLSLRADPAEASRAMLAAVGDRRPSALVYSSRLTAHLDHREIPGRDDIPVHELDLDSVEGAKQMLSTLRSSSGSVVMCATDRELRRVTWLAGASDVDTSWHTFTNSRIDFRDDGRVEADIAVEWDLGHPFHEIFRELIRMIDHAEPGSLQVGLPWEIVFRAGRTDRPPRTWDVSDM